MKFITAIITAAVSLPIASNAATITWAPAVNLISGGNNDTFVSQNGSFVVGFNGGNTTQASPVQTTTVGTAVFTAIDSAGISGAGVTGGGVTVTGNFTNQAGPTTFGDGEFNSVVPVFNLINSAVYAGTSFSMSGLTAGNVYEMQIMVNDARGGTGASIRDTAWEVGFNDGAGGTTIAATADLTNRPFNVSADPNLAGDYIIGTFTADGTGSQSFDFAATRGNNPGDAYVVGNPLTNVNGGQAQFNAFQLRDITPVPEPSSGILAGLAGAGLILRRRR